MIALLLTLSCPVTVWDNATSEPWTDFDRDMYQQVLKRCPVIYGKSFVCVTLFRKFNVQQYTVLCGEKR